MWEIGQLLHDSTVRRVKSSWEAEALDCSKLDVLQRLLVNGCKLRCVHVASKRARRIAAKLRGETAEQEWRQEDVGSTVAGWWDNAGEDVGVKICDCLGCCGSFLTDMLSFPPSFE